MAWLENASILEAYQGDVPNGENDLTEGRTAQTS